MRSLLLLLAALLVVPAHAQTHADLVDFYHAWRGFQAPPRIDGVPDYSEATVFRQHRELAAWQTRLAAFDTTGWSVTERIDWHLVKAEMNGLDFDHRVLQPWKNNPAWYVQIWTYQSDTPEHEGPVPYGFIDLWKFPLPLSSADAAELETKIRTIPGYLATAKVNLTGNQRDLWRMGIAVMHDQATDLAGLRERVDARHASLRDALAGAEEASADLADWLEQRLPEKTGASGVGIENYDWYMRHVHLSPFTWEDELRILEQELARSYRSLRLEENRNKGLPELEVIQTREQYMALMNEAVDEHIAFYGDKDIMDVRPWLDRALRERIRGYTDAGPQSFFAQINFRDPAIMRAHDYHWIDLARMQEEPHASPIRANPLLYNIWDSRAEGMATAMEELMMDAGLFDDKPRTRELIWILIAQRGARAIAGMRMHSNEWTLQEASDYAVAWTPRGWMTPNGELVGFEQHLYLMQPGYGSSYLTGKAQLDRLFADYQHQQGDAFTVRGFYDGLDASGLIPVSLIRWEMTGLSDWVPFD